MPMPAKRATPVTGPINRWAKTPLRIRKSSKNEQALPQSSARRWIVRKNSNQTGQSLTTSLRS
jgi:hypothetical protein